MCVIPLKTVGDKTTIMMFIINTIFYERVFGCLNYVIFSPHSFDIKSQILEKGDRSKGCSVHLAPPGHEFNASTAVLPGRDAVETLSTTSLGVSIKPSGLISRVLTGEAPDSAEHYLGDPPPKNFVAVHLERTRSFTGAKGEKVKRPLPISTNISLCGRGLVIAPW